MDANSDEELRELAETRAALDADDNGSDDGYEAEYRRGFGDGKVSGILLGLGFAAFASMIGVVIVKLFMMQG